MGGRGSWAKASAGQKAEEQQKEEAKYTVKTSQSQQEIIDYVSEQVSVNLNNYRDSFTERFEDSREVLVYWKDVPNTVKQRVESLETKGRLVTEDFGAWGKVIGLKRRRR